MHWIVTGYIFAGLALIIMAVLLIKYTAHFIRYIRKHKLVSKKHLLIALAPIPIASVGMIFMTNFDQLVHNKPLNLSALYTSFPFITIAIIVPILTGPAFTQWIRHRK